MWPFKKKQVENDKIVPSAFVKELQEARKKLMAMEAKDEIQRITEELMQNANASPFTKSTYAAEYFRLQGFKIMHRYSEFGYIILVPEEEI